ncbi:MAG: ATP-NAD kinase family protein [Colwellia sp.]
MKPFKLGLLINPIAGIGGSVALKGSDNLALHALALGAAPKANQRTHMALEILLPYKNEIVIYTANDQMGEQCASDLGFQVERIYQVKKYPSTARDTELAIAALLAQQVDLILFAGGDGTARNIAKSIDEYSTAHHASHNVTQQIPVLGIPAGCKIHSGVYAITPKAAGRIVELMITKQLVTLTTGDVMDIDENLFRRGVVKAKRYGEMQIPSELRYVQAVKSGGKESDELVLQDIAADIIDNMDDDLYVIGSGSTTAFLMTELNISNTLLGIDIVQEQALIASDVSEHQLWQHLQQAESFEQVTKLVITLIGGQGHIFGRGNQQLSPRIIRFIIGQNGGKENILIIATKTKLTALEKRPLISDTGDNELDQMLSGFIAITTGYKDQVLYPVASPM